MKIVDLSTQEKAEAFFGSKQAQADLLDDLLYASYRHNRDRTPTITPEQWKQVYGAGVGRMEGRYQHERAVLPHFLTPSEEDALEADRQVDERKLHEAETRHS